MPEKLDRCVNDVKGQKGVGNAYAICQSAVKKHKETHLKSEREAQKFPYPFPAINSKDATKERIEPYDAEREAVSIGGGLSAQSVGGKVIDPDKEFDKVHEALEGEAREPIDRLEMEGADPSMTLDPEPSPTGARDPSQTLDPATEQYDYGNYGTDEGGPGSGPRKGGGRKQPEPTGDNGTGNYEQDVENYLVDIMDYVGEGDMEGALQAGMSGMGQQLSSDDLDDYANNLEAQGDPQSASILRQVALMKSSAGEAVMEACPQMDKLHEALTHESKS